MEISVVIPYYNREKFIVECLDSIRAQTYPASEIIVVDDCSTAESAAFLRTIPDIRVVTRETNGGVGAARNTGFRAARYEWVAFQDSDDTWAPEKLERQVQFLEAHPGFDGVQCGLQSVYLDGSKSVWGEKPAVNQLGEALRRNITSMQALLIRRSVMEELGGHDERFRCSEDHELSIRMALAGVKIAFLPEVMVNVRRFKHGHLEGNWLRYLTGEWMVLRKHWRCFDRELGFLGVRNYLAIAIRRAGMKKGHVLGRALLCCGWLLGGFDLNTD